MVFNVSALSWAKEEETAMSESRMAGRQETRQEKRYKRSRVPEEAVGRLEGRGKLSSTARAVQLTNGRPVCLYCCSCSLLHSHDKGRDAPLRVAASPTRA